MPNINLKKKKPPICMDSMVMTHVPHDLMN